MLFFRSFLLLFKILDKHQKSKETENKKLTLKNELWAYLKPQSFAHAKQQ